jgi:outer membrane protein assembly factor BamB
MVRSTPRILSTARYITFLAIVCSWSSATRSTPAADWPQWRYDAGHTAASPHDLPEKLQPAWTRQYTQRVPVWDDPLNRDIMGYDTTFEPVVSDGRMFVGFNDCDRFAALDCDSGKELWSFFADGPVRLPAACFQDKVYFVSDDGYLYCVAAADGTLKWKFRAGPSARKVIGNKRLISAWPARGGPVVRDGVVYFAGSIWPFEGTFIYALDAETGNVVWVNDSTGAQYILQPHSALSFAGVAPQGTLVATNDYLLVPGGRSVPCALHRDTGRFKYFHLNAGGKGVGGSLVVADDNRFFVHTRRRGTKAYRLEDGQPAAPNVNEPVLADGVVYAATDPSDSAEGAVQAFGGDNQVRWQVAADGSGDLIKAGNRLYAAGKASITAIDPPYDGTKAKVVWSILVAGKIRRLLAADGKLFAVTLDGRIMAFGAEPAATIDSPPASVPPAPKLQDRTPQSAERMRAIVQAADAYHGYALYYGLDDGALFESLLTESRLHVVGVDPQPAKIDKLRGLCHAWKIYGKRVALHADDLLGFQAPPYIAHLVLFGKSMAEQLADEPLLRQAYESVRPYGGGLWMPVTAESHPALLEKIAAAKLPQAKFMEIAGGTMILREGPLPGSAWWTHAYGDAANTVKSNDKLVRAPLGVLWFGGNPNTDVLPRHGHGPSEQVVGGRLFIEGINSFSARDVYTGRVLWRREFEDLDTFDVYYDGTFADTPLSPAYNQLHIPGANSRGTNFVATPEGVYLVAGSKCVLLDAATGKNTLSLTIPADEDGKSRQWGFVGVYEDVLLGGAGFGDFGRLGYEFQPIKKKRRTGIAWGADKSASRGLVAFDRRTGNVLWQVPAEHAFLHNGIVAGNGRIYCLDKLPLRVEQAVQRRGGKVTGYRLLALDAKTGRQLWSRSGGVFGSWLSYSEPRDILLQAGSAAADRSMDEVEAGMAAHRGENGSVIWENKTLKYSGPCMIHHDMIVTNISQHNTSSGAFSLLDGSEILVTDPITGQKKQWRITRDKGCNTAVASEHLLTFRDGAASFYDLNNISGTASLGGFKSGCSSNLIAADGVLNAPDYTRSCSCAYQNQTSLSMIHLPDVETWTTGQFAGKRDGARIRRIGVNFGAPGDRRSSEGSLWVEHPRVGGPSPDIPIELEGSPEWFCRHSSRVTGDGLTWVAASGVQGVRKISLQLGGDAASGKPLYTVRLYFAELDETVAAGDRVFDVTVQGHKLLSDFDVVVQAGGPNRLVVKEFEKVAAGGELAIELTPKSDRPTVISGIEVIEQ